MPIPNDSVGRSSDRHAGRKADPPRTTSAGLRRRLLMPLWVLWLAAVAAIGVFAWIERQQYALLDHLTEGDMQVLTRLAGVSDEISALHGELLDLMTRTARERDPATFRASGRAYLERLRAAVDRAKARSYETAWLSSPSPGRPKMGLAPSGGGSDRGDEPGAQPGPSPGATDAGSNEALYEALDDYYRAQAGLVEMVGHDVSRVPASREASERRVLRVSKAIADLSLRVAVDMEKEARLVSSQLRRQGLYLTGGALLVLLLVSIAAATRAVRQTHAIQAIHTTLTDLATGRRDGVMPKVDDDPSLAEMVRGLESYRAVQERMDAVVDELESANVQAFSDDLTQLFNRAKFNLALRDSVARHERYNEPFALMFIDLDRFKEINDSLGHAAGDALLVEIAGRLKDCLRESDLLFRLGGDEFTVIAPRHDDHGQLSLLAQRIVERIAEPLRLEDGATVTVGASIGIAICPEHGWDAERLLRSADEAMYQAKQSRRGRYRFASREANEKSVYYLSLHADLRAALAEERFYLDYQPVVDAASGRPVSAEALIRWRLANGGSVRPLEFLPQAERMGLTHELGAWTIRAVCRQLRAWRDQGLPGLPGLPVSINLTAGQFHDADLIGWIEAGLAESGVPAGLLQLELPEAAILDDVDRAFHRLTRLERLGVGLALDDFGAGHAAIGYVLEFPIRQVKIDRSLVGQIDSSDRARVIVMALIRLCQELGLTVVAKGVENAAQRDLLVQGQCRLAQGFHYRRPVTPTDLAGLI